jgi:DNA topoisomerase-1
MKYIKHIKHKSNHKPYNIIKLMPSFYNNKKNNKNSSSRSLSSYVKVATDTLLIVESPAKCSTIIKYLGSGYRCIATMGHMRYLDGLDSINVKNDYKLNFTIMDSKKPQIEKIKSEIKMAARILLATDDDREGESIAWHICEMFNLSLESTERITFHEITKDAIERSIMNPKKINMNIVHSAHARQILDLFIGYKISPLLWQHISSDKGSALSAGRCQTPALRIIYDNEIERNIIKKDNDDNKENNYYYSVFGYFTKFNLPFSLNATFKSDKENIGALESFLQSSIHINTKYVFKLSGVPQMHYSKAPEPFTTSRLQQVASNEFAFSPNETMEICQILYERGLITYIRTTGKSYSAEFINHTNDYIREKWGEKYINLEDDEENKCIKNDTAAHEAIRPTDLTRLTLSGDFHAREQKIYKLIWKNTLESCMSDYTFLSLETIIDTNIQCTDHYSYAYTCQKPLFCGWKAVQGFTNEQLSQHTMMDYLLNVRENSEIPCNKIETKISFDSIGAPHYTEARLIQLLEEKEIGRPSTYSAIIEKIKEREYVKKQNISGQKKECIEHVVAVQEKKISLIITKKDFGNENNKLVITPTGKNVLEFLISHFPRLFSYNYTQIMEAHLDDIANGQNGQQQEVSKDKLKTVCDECIREIGENIAKYKSFKKEKTFFKIDDQHIFLNGKYGPVVMVLRPEDIEKYSNDDGGGGGVNYNDLIQSDNIAFKKVKPGIMIEDLQNGKYTNLSEIIVEDCLLERIIGTYGGYNILLKNGRFGKYILWGKNEINRKSIEKTHLNSRNFSDISLDEVIRLIESEPESGIVSDASLESSVTGIIRIINDDTSIRTGKYGDYIFYKTVNMKKPKFISLKSFNKDYKKCSDADIISFINGNI